MAGLVQLKRVTKSLGITTIDKNVRKNTEFEMASSS